MNAKIFISTTGKSLSRAECSEGEDWAVETLLKGTQVNCFAIDPHRPDVVYAGTQGNGLLRSEDRGLNWHPHGMAGHSIKSLAVSRAEDDVIYLGTKPPAIYVTRDGGESWSELESFRQMRRRHWFTPAEPGDPYVLGLDVSPTDPNVIVAGVEYGAMLRSADGGQTWHGHLKNTSRDCHSLTFHQTDGNWVYQAGGGWPAAVSRDGGATWRQPRRGLGWSLYAMACAADPQCPEVWYVSAAPLLKFPQVKMMPRAHWDGHASAGIFRRAGGTSWERLEGGLPQPLNYMAYALLTDPAAPGHLYTGLSNGDVWHSGDYGDHWQQLPFNLTGVRHAMVML